MLIKVLFWALSWIVSITALWCVMKNGHKKGLELREQTRKQVEEEFRNEMRQKEFNK